jgi:hypothetical protein
LIGIWLKWEGLEVHKNFNGETSWKTEKKWGNNVTVNVKEMIVRM